MLAQSLEIMHASGGRFKHFDAETGDVPWLLETDSPGYQLFRAQFLTPTKSREPALRDSLGYHGCHVTWSGKESGLASNTVVLLGALVDKLALAADLEYVYHFYAAFSPFTTIATFLHVTTHSCAAILR